MVDVIFQQSTNVDPVKVKDTHIKRKRLGKHGPVIDSDIHSGC